MRRILIILAFAFNSFYGFAQHSFKYDGKSLNTSDSIYLVDASLDRDVREYVFDNVNEALKTAELRRKDKTKNKIRIYIAPSVYWLSNPDDKAPIAGAILDKVFSQVRVKVSNLEVIGMSGNPKDVVIADNRGQGYGCRGRYEMLNITGDDITFRDLTIGNYCNIDLVYDRNHKLDKKKRTTNITPAFISNVRGDRVYLKNCVFEGYKNANPFVNNFGGRTLFDECTITCEENSLNSNAVYHKCKFNFFSDKVVYSAMQTGLVFLNCDFNFTLKKHYVTKTGGLVAMVDCHWTSKYPEAKVWISKSNQIDQRAYLSNNTLNGHELDPITMPWVLVDITNKPLLKAFKLSDGSYNIYNLMRGEDGWNPTNQNIKNFKSVPTMLAITQRKVTIENEVDEYTIGARAYDFSNLSGDAEPVNLKWDYEKPEYAQYLQISTDEKGRCHIKGIKENANETRLVFIKVTTDDGLESSSRITIDPKELPAPEFSKAPTIKRVKDELVLEYGLNLQEGLRDESVINWYRSTKDEQGKPNKNKWHLVGASNIMREPMRTYKITDADKGCVIMATIATKTQRSQASESIISLFSDVLNKTPKKSSFETDFKNFPPYVQKDIDDGLWTLTLYKPEDTNDVKWKYERKDNYVWKYDRGSDGAYQTYGLNAAHRGARMVYTPVAGMTCNAMNIHLELDPFKEVGQGFSKSKQYLDIYFKYDTRTMTGYGLRIIRPEGSNHSVDVQFMEFTSGAGKIIGKPVATSGYRKGCVIDIEVKGKVATAKLSNPIPVSYYDNEKNPTNVTLSAELPVVNKLGGFGLQHTGTVNDAGIVLKNLKINWK